MPANKSHHFVPQFLLRRFAEPSSDASVSLLNIQGRRVISRASIKGQAASDYLYGKDQVVEEKMKKLEGMGASLLRAIDTSGVAPLPLTPEHTDLIFFAAVQWARTPSAGAEIDAMANATAQLVLRTHQEAGRHLDIDPNTVQVRKANPITDSLKLVIGEKTFLHLTDLVWMLVRNEADTEFVLGDTAVVLHNQWRQSDPVQAHVGFGAVGLQLFFPISPRRLLILYDPRAYAPTTKRGARPVLSRNQDVRQVNMLALCDAYANAYFTGDARTAQQILGKLPRDAPRHKSTMKHTFSGPDSQLVGAMFRRPHQFKIELPVLRLLRPAPTDSHNHLRDWSKGLEQQRRSERAAGGRA